MICSVFGHWFRSVGLVWCPEKKMPVEMLKCRICVFATAQWYPIQNYSLVHVNEGMYEEKLSKLKPGERVE